MKVERAQKQAVQIFALGLFFIIVLFGGWLMLNKTSDKNRLDSKYQDLVKTKNFIVNIKDKYYLVNEKGKKVNKEVYDSATLFFNGAALVKEEGKVAKIINIDGKTIIDGKGYDDVSFGNGLIKARKGNDNKYFDTKGKEIKFLNDFEAYPFEYSGMNLSTQFKNKEKYILVNYDGKKVFESSQPIKINKYYNDGNTYYMGVIVSGKKNIVYNFIDNRVFYKNESGKNINLISVSDNNEKTFTYENRDGAAIPQFGMVENGKELFEITNLSTLTLEGNNILSKVGNEEFLLDKKGKQVVNVKDKAYLNKDKYVYNDKYQLIIKNGKKEEKIKCKTLISNGYEPRGLYIVRHTTAGACKGENLYYIFDEKGKQLSNVGYSTIESFDKGKLTIATDKDNKYYLIDKKGNKKSKAYERITRMNSKDILFKAESDKMTFVLNENGKVLFESTTPKIDILSIAKAEYITEDLNGKYSLYDIKNKKYILKDVDAFSLGINSIYIVGSDDVYTYQGHKIEI